MKCYELAQETGWTPAQAFEDNVDVSDVREHLEEIHAAPPTAQQQLQQQRADFHKMKCMGSKCGKRAMYNFDDQQFPKFCKLHKYEGMVDVGVHTPVEPRQRLITNSNQGGHTAVEKVGVGKGNVGQVSDKVRNEECQKGVRVKGSVL